MYDESVCSAPGRSDDSSPPSLRVETYLYPFNVTPRHAHAHVYTNYVAIGSRRGNVEYARQNSELSVHEMYLFRGK